MSVTFTHYPTTSHRHLPQYRSAASSPPDLERAFRNVVIDGPGGILTNMDVAAETAEATSHVGIALTHWSGVLHPVAAARQIAALDRVSDGRLALRMLVGPDGRTDDVQAGDVGHAPRHAEALRDMDEYLVLLKRLWANDKPFDYEGPHHSVRSGFVPEKGPQHSDIPIRIGGVSGIALDVAGKHATVFELTPAPHAEMRGVIERVETAASRYGRAGKISFALPVLLDDKSTPSEGASASFVSLAGSPKKVAQTLFSYAALGINEFMVSGLDDEDTMERFVQEIAPMFQRAVPIGLAAKGNAVQRRPQRWVS